MYNSQNIPRRTTSYNSNIPTQKTFENRPLRIYRGDMVQVINPGHPLVGKFGLVEEVNPKNPQCQVVVKIGKISNTMRFRDLKFCTRISYRNDTTNDDEIPVEKINQYIDQVDGNAKEIDDDIGNRR